MKDLFELSYCSECGEARVPHAIYKAQFYIDPLVEKLCVPLEWTSKWFDALVLRYEWDRTLYRALTVLARRGIVSMKESFDPRDSIRTKALFEGAHAAAVTLRQFRLFDLGESGLMVAEKGDDILVFTTMPRPRGFHSPSLDWMDDKGALKPFLMKHAIPTADGGVAKTFAEAEAIFDRVGAPVITKPHQGTRGRHTTIGIVSKAALKRAFDITKQISPSVIVEKELQGIVHRVTLIAGRAAAIAKRDYPHVIGDGLATVRELLERENTDPRRDDFSFYKIVPNERAEAQLREHQMSWESVPALGERVILNDKVSRLHGTVTIDVTDQAHPENIALFNRIGETLGDPLVGVDFMIGDIAKSWKEQPGCGLIECNAMPYIDIHHYMYEGASRNVGKLLWEHIFAA